MLTEPTMEKLHGLRLGAMATAWTAQREDPKMNDIDFDGRFGMLVDAEHLARDNKRVARALQEAKLRISNACIEDIDYAPKRELDRALVRQLGTCAWIGSHANVIITGATGTGKSYLACALAQKACRGGHRVAYRMAATGSGGTSGGFWPTPPGVPPMVQLFVEVENVETAIAKAIAHGGAIIIPPQRLPDGDEMAVLRDSQGLSFGVMRRAQSG